MARNSKARKAEAQQKKPRGASKTRRPNRQASLGEQGLPVGKSAQELGVTFPGSHCDEAKLIAHFWTEVDRPYGGSLLQCKLCRRHLWLPASFADAVVMHRYIDKHDTTEGYCRYLNRHRPAKMLMAKLQDLRILETEVSDKREFARLADKILSDKEYDRKEV